MRDKMNNENKENGYRYTCDQYFMGSAHDKQNKDLNPSMPSLSSPNSRQCINDQSLDLDED